MEAEHHHDPDMAIASDTFNAFATGCDLSAQKRRSPGFRGVQITGPRRPIDYRKMDAYFIGMLVQADHFRFRLLNRPLPRAV